jgi:hypothetical protein
VSPAVEAALAKAEQDAAVVTVNIDGLAPLTGTVHPHPTLPYGHYTLRTGGRGRPRVFHFLDVAEVIFE